MSHSTIFIPRIAKCTKIITFFILFALLAIENSKATHIVGGDLQIVYTGNEDFYVVNMKVYFDDIQGDPALFSEEYSIYPSIYRKADNQFITNVELNRKSIDFIDNGIGCTDMSVIRTRLFRYQGLINLTDFTDLQGYYIVWERCCRNGNIKNIFDPSNTGEVFYLEFPTVFLKNSSPSFKPLKNQYWCRGVEQYLDFSGVDSDGDELRYEMVAPLAGHSDRFDPSPNYPDYGSTPSGPYNPVIWWFGYGVNNQIPGAVPLEVDPTTGMLTFNPNSTGLYVFSVKVSEYRLGIKIGETRREFQILIQDCPVNYPPQIALDKTFGNGVGQIDVYLNEVKTIDLFLADETTTSQFSADNITFVKVISNLNSSMFSVSGSSVLFPGRDTVTTQLIINPCHYLKIKQETIERIEIVVRDNRCPIKYDTLLLDVTFKIPNNVPPTIEVLPTGSNQNTLYPWEVLHLLVKGQDADLTDRLTLTATGNGFNMDDYNMYFQNAEGVAAVSSPFVWSPDCDKIGEGPWKVTFTVRDNTCVTANESHKDVWLNLVDRVSTVEGYKPVNLVTANEDGMNDAFFMHNPPTENCEYYFKSISIYNAWGARIFYNTSKDFVWKPERSTRDAVYYYDFDFNKKQIKGWVQVISSE